MDNPLIESDQTKYDKYVELHQELKKMLLLREHLEFDFLLQEIRKIRIQMEICRNNFRK